jgi:hypothetical protein
MNQTVVEDVNTIIKRLTSNLDADKQQKLLDESTVLLRNIMKNAETLNTKDALYANEMYQKFLQRNNISSSSINDLLGDTQKYIQEKYKYP